MDTIRILTLWQPWASLVALGLKRYETRSWDTKYRGKLAIHAAKRPFVSVDGTKTLDKAAWLVWLDALEEAYKVGIITDKSRLPLAHQLPLGSIVAIADLTECERMTNNVVWAKANIVEQTKLEIMVGDWQRGRYAWKLENIHSLEKPIVYKGGQGLRTIDDIATLNEIDEMIKLAV